MKTIRTAYSYSRNIYMDKKNIIILRVLKRNLGFSEGSWECKIPIEIFSVYIYYCWQHKFFHVEKFTTRFCEFKHKNLLLLNRTASTPGQILLSLTDLIQELFFSCNSLYRIKNKVGFAEFICNNLRGSKAEEKGKAPDENILSSFSMF